MKEAMSDGEEREPSAVGNAIDNPPAITVRGSSPASGSCRNLSDLIPELASYIEEVGHSNPPTDDRIFWVNFLQKYDTIVGAHHDVLEDDDALDAIAQRHAVGAWLSGVVLPCIKRASAAKFFARDDNNDFENVDAGYLMDFIKTDMDLDEILDNEPLIFEIPYRIDEILAVS